MDTKPTQRKAVTRRKRVRCPAIYRPEEVTKYPEEITKYSYIMPTFCSASLLFNN